MHPTSSRGRRLVTMSQLRRGGLGAHMRSAAVPWSLL